MTAHDLVTPHEQSEPHQYSTHVAVTTAGGVRHLTKRIISLQGPMQSQGQWTSPRNLCQAGSALRTLASLLPPQLLPLSRR